ncbi:MAG: hypothetical protein Q9163_005525 [Psora crenata]
MDEVEAIARGFDKNTAYLPQDEGKHHPSLADIRGSPLKVLQAMDEFARTKRYLMSIGHYKGGIIRDSIIERKPLTMVELGGYVGYSTILFGDAFRSSGGKKFFCLEMNPEFAAVIMSLVDLAGLSDIVKVIVGQSADSIKRLHAAKVLQEIDLLFLDHYKPAYTPDLKLCEDLGLVRPGTVLAADNVINPGNPSYVEYVRSSVAKKREKYQSGETAGDGTVGFSDSSKNQYQGSASEEMPSIKVKGNPNLIYQSKLVESVEPTGVLVSLRYKITARALSDIIRTALR